MRFPIWLIRVSIFLNTCTCGPKGYSLCARFWEGRLDGRPFHSAAVKVIDTLFWFDPGHCRKSWQLRSRGCSLSLS